MAKRTRTARNRKKYTPKVVFVFAIFGLLFMGYSMFEKEQRDNEIIESTELLETKDQNVLNYNDKESKERSQFFEVAMFSPESKKKKKEILPNEEQEKEDIKEVEDFIQDNHATQENEMKSEDTIPIENRTSKWKGKNVTSLDTLISKSRYDQVLDCPNFISYEDSSDIEICKGTYGVGDFSSYIFLMKDVYVNRDSTIMSSKDSSLIYSRGCLLDPPSINPVEKELDTAISLHTKYQNVYYHFWTEFIIGLMIMKPFILQNPHIPILIKDKNKKLLEFSKKFIGIDHLPVQYDLVTHPILVHKNIAPVIPPCALNHAYKESFPIELYNPLRLKLNEFFHLEELKPTKILIEQRKGARSLIQFELIKNYLETNYPSESLVFIGLKSISIEETAKNFANAAIYIGPHGSGFTNILFMKSGTSVIEIRSSKWNLDMYEQMSDSFGIRHTTIIGEGNKQDPIHLSPSDLEDLYSKIENQIKLSPFLKF